jgi:hypothetical protein
VTPEKRAELLGVITEHAMTAVQVGYVNTGNIVCHDGLLVTEACPAALYAIIDWVRAQNDAFPKTAADAHLIMASMVDWQSGPGLHSRTRGLLIH